MGHVITYVRHKGEEGEAGDISNCRLSAREPVSDPRLFLPAIGTELFRLVDWVSQGVVTMT